MREACWLRVPNEDRLSGSVLAELRKLSGRNRARAGAKKPATPEEVVELFHVYTKARLEDWTAFSGTLQGQGGSVDAMTDVLIVEMLRQVVEEMVNEGNPLRSWLEFSRAKRRKKKLERTRPSGAK